MDLEEITKKALFTSDEWPIPALKPAETLIDKSGARSRLFSHAEPLDRQRITQAGRLEITAPPSDLYFWWHQLSRFRVSRPVGGKLPRRFAFIAEGNFAGFRTEFQHEGRIEMWDEYGEPLNPAQSNELGSFFTFDVVLPLRSTAQPPNFINVFPIQRDDSVDEVELKKLYIRLVHSANIKRLQFGFPRGEGKLKRYQSGEAPPLPEVPVAASANTEKIEASVVLGVIDDGAAFAHESVRVRDASEPRSRVAFIWNQTRQSARLNERYWTSLANQDWYGGQLAAAAMSDVMKLHSTHAEVDELGCYADLFDADSSDRALRGRDSHGAAVMTTMAGHLDAGSVKSTPLNGQNTNATEQLDDPAAKAPLIFVELPYEQIAISSGRWMPIAALDGVRYIIAKARATFVPTCAARVPVVINISSGTNTGPHDGTSMIESALTEILKSDPWVAITVAAGNSRLSNTHIDVIVPPHTSYDMTVRVPPLKKHETYTEFWPQWVPNDGDNVPLDFAAITFGVVSPGGDLRKGLGVDGQGAVFTVKDDVPIAGFQFASNAVQSVGRPMALLVVAPTMPHEFLPKAPYGNWIVRCTNTSPIPLRIKAWVERDETVFGIRQPQFAHFVSSGDVAPPALDWEDAVSGDVSRLETTSNMAGTRHAFAVAAGTGGRQSGYVSSYSGGGGGDSSARPQLIARADRNPAQPGVPVWGNYRSTRRHMNGTSIAAPIAVRWIANNFARGVDRLHIECLAMFSQPREHPRLSAKRGRERIAAGEGRLFIEDVDSSPQQCARGSDHDVTC